MREPEALHVEQAPLFHRCVMMGKDDVARSKYPDKDLEAYPSRGAGRTAHAWRPCPRQIFGGHSTWQNFSPLVSTS